MSDNNRRGDAPETPDETYLGDGVYASHDGYHLVLDLRGQSDAKICLEPDVLFALDKYRERVAQFYRDRARS